MFVGVGAGNTQRYGAVMEVRVDGGGGAEGLGELQRVAGEEAGVLAERGLRGEELPRRAGVGHAGDVRGGRDCGC